MNIDFILMPLSKLTCILIKNKEWIIPILQTFITVISTLLVTWLFHTANSAMDRHASVIATLKFMQLRILAESQLIKSAIEYAKENHHDKIILHKLPLSTSCSLAEYISLVKTVPDYTFMLLDQNNQLNLFNSVEKEFSISRAKDSLKCKLNDFEMLEKLIQESEQYTWWHYWKKSAMSFLLPFFPSPLMKKFVATPTDTEHRKNENEK